MYQSPANNPIHFRASKGERSQALIAVLALVLIMSLLVVMFVTMTGLDFSASASYSQSLGADQLARGGLQLVISELQLEMQKDAPPDLTYPSNPLYTNIYATNIEPQGVGTNAGMPNLVKISTNAPFFTGVLTSGMLNASTNSSTTPALNGRTVSTNIWNQPFFGTFPNNASAPYWIMMTRGGATNAAGLPFGATTANSVNNSAPANTNYVVGRIAYAIYDESGLLDITVAGYPTNGSTAALTASQLQSIKGTLAGADVSAITNASGIGIDPNALTAWRNQTTAANATTYTNYVTSFLSTNAGMAVYPGDTTFLSRQDLIQAAENGTAGLTTNVLPNLTTFTRERNAPSWGPSQDASTMGGTNSAIYAYKSNALTAGSTNVFIPFIRHSSAGTETIYNLDGTTTSNSFAAGDPVVDRRFPLDRLAWVTYEGPSADLSTSDPLYNPAGTDTAIQACFGLVWEPNQYSTSTQPPGLSFPNYNVWQYVGPTGSTEQTSIETLNQVGNDAAANDTTPREPNFFELLQAGILAGSLGMEANYTQGGTYTISYHTYHEMQKTLQIFRIGASIITQYESGCYPIVIEYSQSYSANPVYPPPPNTAWTAWTAPWQACGVSNLPYLTMLHVLSGGENPHTMENFMVFGLWNPYQQSASGPTPTRPPVRLHIYGSVEVANNYSEGSEVGVPFNYGYTPLIYGIQEDVSSTIQLSTTSNSGVSGFSDPHALLPADLSSTLTAGSSAGMTWATLPSVTTPQGGTVYAGFRLPDLPINPITPASGGPGYTYTSSNSYSWSTVIFNVNADLIHPFNCWLEYLNASGAWVPYDYHAGINDYQHTWFSKDPAAFGTSTGGGSLITSSPSLVAFNPPAASSIFYFIKYIWEQGDPLSLRFNYSMFQTDGTYQQWATYLTSSLWSSLSGTSSQTYGRVPSQGSQTLFSSTNGPWVPAGLCRNADSPQPGTPGSATTFASYSDPDGVQRIADSGLFGALQTSPPGASWVGDPYALSTTRTADRPIFLNRPFYSVGELGYVDRDDPFKTLDFFTSKSADAALLDLFTVSRSTSSVVAGRINLNTQNQAALYAVLKNTVSSDALGCLPVPSSTNLTEPSQIATDLVKFTAPSTSSTNILTGKDQIATKFTPTLSLGAGDFSTADEQYVKSRREGVTRALADVGQTRTWNLMIDIVAQSGRYPPTATSLDQFVVEGERHYWLHVAIDRITGQVIDQQLEAVSQ